MANQLQTTTMVLNELKKYSLQLSEQDLCLEQIELLLYRAERLARKASFENETVNRHELQREIEFIKAEIDRIVRSL